MRSANRAKNGTTKQARGPASLDTNVFIYAVEGFGRFEQELSALFRAVDQGEIEAVTSELTLAEALARPFKEESERDQQIYRETLQDRASFHLVSVTRPLLIESARLRATAGLRLPDAIHLATAREAGCSALVTNDDDFRNAPEINVVMLSEAA